MDSLQTLLSQIQSGNLPQLGIWSYFLLAILVAVEGPIATLIGAAAASTGLLRPPFVFIAAASGNLVADSLWYSIGYAGQLDWLARAGSRIGFRREQIEQLQDSMHEHAVKILIFSKLTAGLVIPSLIAAGLVRVPWRRWFPAIVSVEMFWTGTLVIIGYYATHAIQQVEQGMEILAIVSSVLFLFIILWGIRRTLRKKKNVPQIQREQIN